MNDFYVALTGEIFYLWITLNAPSYDVDGVSVLYQEEKWRYVIYFESQERFGNVFIMLLKNRSIINLMVPPFSICTLKSTISVSVAICFWNFIEV